MVDREDHDRLRHHRWYLDRDGRVTRADYDPATQRTNKVRLHRDVMRLEKGDPREVDHIDRSQLNACKSNLRLCTHAQNRQNNGSNRGSTSKYRGVSWEASRGLWKAQGKLDYRNVFIGRYRAEEQAAEAAARWRRENMTHTVEGEVSR
jgi:hypothetical protein